MVFHPLLADVAGASVNPDSAATPLRQMLPGVNCRTERVQRVDLASSEIDFDVGLLVSLRPRPRAKSPGIPFGLIGLVFIIG